MQKLQKFWPLPLPLPSPSPPHHRYIRIRTKWTYFHFQIAGLAVLGLGIWVQVEKGDYVALADSDTGLTGAILIIVTGAVTAVISLLGFLGAIKRSKILLWIVSLIES